MSYYQTIRDTQKAARKVARETGKPGAERVNKNPAGKSRKPDNPYASWIDPQTGWKYKLLKSWQGDNSKEYARWFVWVDGYGVDMGDEYCFNIRPGLNRDSQTPVPTLLFDGTIWESAGAFYAWAWGEK